MDNWELLLKKAEEYGIILTDKQLGQFKDYWEFLNEYNQHTNLVSNSTQDVVVAKHFIDSLAIGLIKDNIGWNEPKTLIDIGIGGGFPGVPIIIANPEWKLCAVDSVCKKTKFIELLAEKLGIQDRIEVINGRAEELARQEDKREKFDLAVARAVSHLSVLSEYCLPFLKKNGYFVAYKAKDVDTEINQSKKALNILGGEITNVTSYDSPDKEDVERNMILVKKLKPTPPAYPRKAGTPKKNPL